MDRRNSRRDTEGHSVLTANRLLDGRIVWLAADNTWQILLSHAQVFPNTEIEEKLAEYAGKAQQEGLVGVYGVQVHTDAGRITPVTSREQIRAQGPSIHPDFVPTWQKTGSTVTA
ncbi:MAG: DUF2849 domain-containing protein [Acetobacter cibinongensis]